MSNLMRAIKKNQYLQFCLFEPQIHVRLLILIILILIIQGEQRLLKFYYLSIEDCEEKNFLITSMPVLQRQLAEREQRARHQQEEEARRIKEKQEEEGALLRQQEEARQEAERQKLQAAREEELRKRPVLQGIVLLEGRFAALMNDEISEVGDIVNEYEVMEISQDSVWLKNLRTEELVGLHLELMEKAEQ